MGSWRNLVAQFPCKEKVESSNLFGSTTYAPVVQLARAPAFQAGCLRVRVPFGAPLNPKEPRKSFGRLITLTIWRYE